MLCQNSLDYLPKHFNKAEMSQQNTRHKEFAVWQDGRAVMSARLENANPHGGKSCPRAQSHRHICSYTYS